MSATVLPDLRYNFGSTLVRLLPPAMYEQCIRIVFTVEYTDVGFGDVVLKKIPASVERGGGMEGTPSFMARVDLDAEQQQADFLM